MITLKINNVEYQARKGQTVLEVAREAGVDIPTLCYHPAVSPYGACRLCMVEVNQRGRTRMVTSCCFPVSEGLQVFTETERVLRARRGVMELLLARTPESESLRAMAAAMGITESRFPTIGEATQDCILCGLCVSVCSEVIGASAISFANRGTDRIVASPFLQPSESCVGCGACAAVCPTGAMTVQWREAEIEIPLTRNKVALTRCEQCGTAISGEPFSRRIQDKLQGELAGAAGLCDRCKRKQAAQSAYKVSFSKQA